LRTSLGIFSLVLLVGFGCGCGHQEPPWYEGIADLSRVPLSPELAPYVEAAVASLQEPVGPDELTSDFALFEDFPRRLRLPDERDAAAAEIIDRWRAEPGNLFWCYLGIHQAFLMHRDDDVNEIHAFPVLNDTTTALGCFFLADTDPRGYPPGKYLRKAEQGAADWKPGDLVWLNIQLAIQEHIEGHPFVAVRRLLGIMPLAREAGGFSCQARLWKIIAWRLGTVDHLDDALYAASLAVALDDHAGVDYRRVSSLVTLTEIMGRRGETDAILDRLPSLMDYAEEHRYYLPLGHALNQADDLALEARDYQRSVEINRRTLAVNALTDDYLNYPRSLANISAGFRMMGQMDSSLVYLLRADDIVKRYRYKNNQAVMKEKMAEYYCQVGDYAKAESLLVKSWGISSRDAAKPREALILLAMIPRALEMGNAGLAYSCLDRLEELKSAIISDTPNKNYEADFEMVSAQLLMRQGEFRRAASALDRAAQAVVDNRGDGRPWRLASLQGGLALLREDEAAAERSFRTCLEIAEKGDNPDILDGSRFRLGHLYLQMNRIDEALDLFAATRSNSAFGSRYRTHLMSQLLTGMALSRTGRNQEALTLFQENLAHLNPDSPRDLKLRFELAEGEALAALGRFGEAQKVLLAVQDASGDLPHQAGFDELKIFSDNVHRMAESDLISLSHDHPELCAGKDPARATLDLAKIFPSGMPHPDPGSPWVAYRVGADRSWGWLVSDRGVTLFPLPGTRALRDLLRPMLADMVMPDRPMDWAAAAELTQVLWGPVRDAWRTGGTLTVAPDGLLHDVPWGALPWGALPLAAPAANGDARLALDHGAIREYHGGPTAKTPPSSPDALALLAVGCNGPAGQNPENPSLPRLIKAEQEAADIAAHWSGTGSRLLVGDKADWRTITGLDLTKFGVIHISSHAEVTHGLPGQSTLRLATPGKDSPVTIPAVSGLHLDAELVYLSCCNAARRLSPGGGGVSDFAGAFLQAGAKSVIASTLWVEEESSAYLAEHFYAHWQEGMSRAEALRAAQQDLRAARSEWNHPAYWAFFRLIDANG